MGVETNMVRFDVAQLGISKSDVDEAAQAICRLAKKVRCKT